MSARALVKKHKKQAERLLAKGKLIEARDLYFKATQLDGNDDTLWAALADIAIRLDHPKDTEFALQRAIAINPNRADHYLALGKAQFRLKNFAAAERSYNSYLMMFPDAVEGHLALAGLLRRLGQWSRAEACYQKALALAPANITALRERGDLLRQQGRYQEALESYQLLQSKHPQAWEGYEGIGAAYRDLGRFEQALAIYKQAFELHPTRAADYEYYLGATYYECGDREAALSHCERSLALDPEHLYAHMLKAFSLLSLGHWQEGWAEYERRLDYPAWMQHATPPLLSTTPRWQGEDIAGATILVEEEEGYGDNFQFARYLPLLAQRCARVVVRCRPAVEPLLRRVAGVAATLPITAAEPGMQIDRYVHMMSLPHLLEPDPAKLSHAVPYLSVDAALVESWRQHIQGEGLKVGLVWVGNPAQVDNAARSIPLPLFKPFADLGGVTFYSLQKGAGAEQLDDCPFPIVDLSAALHTFDDTAAAITSLDLVVSVCTSVCHLAGGLGRPVWTMIHQPATWRWGVAGAKTPWYPGMRLFRQDSERRWEPVIQAVADELAELARKNNNE